MYFSPQGYIIQLSRCMACTLVRKANKRLTIHTMQIIKYCLHTIGTSFSVLVWDTEVCTFQRAIKYYGQWRFTIENVCFTVLTMINDGRGD